MWQDPMMSTTKLTLELRELVENGVDIWDFEYPSYYKGEEKTAFERKVIDHYYFRQIGQETVGRFKHYFRTKIREIMPYYIQLYESEKFMKELDDPFATVDYTESYTETRSGQSSGTSSSSSQSSGSNNNTHKFSNTPQGSLQNLDVYLTEGSIDTGTNENADSGTASSESESSENVTHTLTKKGAMGVTTFGHDMIEFRESFLNVDMMIIDELNDLFLKVY